MAGLIVLLAVVSLGALALAMRGGVRLPHAAMRRTTRPSWVREAPVSRAEAERRSLELLRSVVNDEEWEMFQELGFICVTGHRPSRGPAALPRHRYLVYPHLPLVALLPRSLAPVREYCVQFPEREGAPELPTGDDMLAKWMSLRADEERLLRYANVSSPGCQIPLGQIERDIARLRRWERRRSPDAPGRELSPAG